MHATFRYVPSIAVLLAAAISASGCGARGREKAEPPASKKSAPASAPADEMVRYMGISAKIKGLDPMDLSDTTSAGVAGQIYDTLYAYHYLKRGELIPSLAAAMPEVGEDGLVYTIPIREGVFFQDDPCFPGGEGRELVARDFIYAWKRLADVGNRSSNWPFLAGKIVGLDEFRQYTAEAEGEIDYTRPVEGLEAVDEHTLRITLTEPWPLIQYVLAHLPTAPVPHEAIERYGDEYINHPVGTGAYELESWRHGSELVLVRNENYREEYYPSEGAEWAREAGLLKDAGERLPFIDRAVIRIIPESQPYWLTFLKGGIDHAGIPKDNFGQAVLGDIGDRRLAPDLRERGIEMQTLQEASTFWIAFNMEAPVIGNNLPLRRALSMAIDREDYIQLFLNNRGRPARGPLPPTIKAFNPDLESPYSHYDPRKARDLVAKARRVHGGPLPTLEISMPGTDTTTRQMGEYLTRAWGRIGLKVRYRQMSWPALQGLVDNKSAQMFPMGWVADYPDAQNFMMLYYGPNGSPGPNNTNYSNPAFDKLYEKAIRMPLGPQRREAFQRLERMVVRDMPNVFTLHRVAFVLIHPWLKNYKIKPNWFGGTLKFQKIDVAMRREMLGR